MRSRPLLGTVTVVIGDGEDQELALDELVPIEEEDLSEEFRTQPARYAYVAMLAAQAESMWNAAKQGTERTKARADDAERTAARDAQEKVTEAIIANRVLVRDDVQEAEEIEAGYRYQFLLMRAIVQSMDQRAQMLISLGAHLRAESEQTGMLIRDTKARLEELASQKKPRL